MLASISGRGPYVHDALVVYEGVLLPKITL
jgi:hypothetical protein